MILKPKVFLSYHRADTKYRNKVENILTSHQINYYVVPPKKNFNGKSAQFISDFLSKKLSACNILLCLIGQETYSRPHVDREIHFALKGYINKRMGIVGVHLPSREDNLLSIDLKTFPSKLWKNKDYVVWVDYKDLNSNITKLCNIAISKSLDKKILTNHTNKCMQLKTSKYYDN